MDNKLVWFAAGVIILALLTVSVVGYSFYRTGFYHRDKSTEIFSPTQLKTDRIPVLPEQRPPGYEDFSQTAAASGVSFYRGQLVHRVEGKFLVLAGSNNLLKLNTGRGDKFFRLTWDTKAVCQPSGFLRVETSTGQAISANDVFIEDKSNESLGIPWGVEISGDTIKARAVKGSDTQLFYRPETGTVTDLPNVMYVWFKTCDER